MAITDRSYEAILVEQIDRVARITLNRPERRNAVSRAVQNEIVDAIEACAHDPGVHAVIIRGAGKSFCAGYDVTPSAPAASHGGAAAEMSLPRRAVETLATARGWSRIWNSPLPVIAQIHGHCLAGGTDLALNCDIIITAEDATISFPALRMGGTPPTNMWLYHVGVQWSKRLLFTGDTFTGRMAEKIGFALEAVPVETLDAHVLALAKRIAAVGRDIVAINKHVLNRGVDLMGRTMLQEISAPMDSIANQAPEMAAFQARAQEIGLSAAFQERDAPFAEGVPIDIPGEGNEAMNSMTDRSAVELAEAYLVALQAKDKQAILSILAENFALEVPCNISGTNDLSDSWQGLEAADANYENTFRKIEILKYSGLEFTQGEDRNVAFAEGLGVMTLANGNPYRNRYIFRFDVEGGKIRRIREYLNPITAALAMGRPLPQP